MSSASTAFIGELLQHSDLVVEFFRLGCLLLLGTVGGDCRLRNADCGRKGWVGGRRVLLSCLRRDVSSQVAGVKLSFSMRVE